MFAETQLAKLDLKKDFFFISFPKHVCCIEF